MSGDLNTLAATWSALKDADKQARGVVDLLKVDKQVRMDTGRYGKFSLLCVLVDNCHDFTALSFCVLY